nr:T9SS type A sorting domain-containing protein [Saprospiraceae bacterium]
EGNNDWGGGNKSILIHTERGLFYDSLGISEETLVHEASHTSLDEYHAKSPSWLDAQNKDNNYISSYARDNPEREDIAESFLLWLAVTYRSERISKVNLEKIIKAIPNRLKYFDNQNFKLNPINCAITSFDVLDDEIYLYPNPTGGILKIKNFNYNNDSDKTSTELYSAEGRLISKIAVIDNEVNLTYLPNGHYFLKFISNGQSRYLPIVKKE